jgi:tetratricopeptide (TPR) repeat protein
MSMRFSTSAIIVVALLSACSSTPTQKAPPPTERGRFPAVDPDAPKTAGAPAAKAPAGATTPAPLTAVPGAPLAPRAKADFDRAIGAMRGGNSTEAELEFKQMTLAYPQLAAPYVNLGILYRKANQLEQSEQALKNAVQRNSTSAIGWTELGATQCLRGEFADSAASDEKAIAADPNYAPAYRNLGVVSDLYLGDPERALSALERYKELTGEDRPVTSWIAELRQRTGKSPVKPAATPAQPGDAPTEAVPAPPASTSGTAPPKAGE